MSDNSNTTNATIVIQLGGATEAVRAVSSLSKSERDLKINAEAANKAMGEIAKAQSSFRQIQNDIKTLGTNVKNTATVVGDLDDAIGGLEHQKAAVSLARHFADVANAMGDADKQGKLLRTTLEQIGATKDEIETASSAFKAFSSEGSPTATPKLSASTAVSSISGIGRGVSDLVSGNIVGGVQAIAAASAQAAPALTAAGVGLGSIAAAAAFALPALILVASAVQKFAGIIQSGQQGIDDGIATVTAYNAAQLLTTEQIKEQIKAKEDEAKVNEAIKKTLDDSIAAARSQGIPDAANPAVAKRDELAKSLQTTYSELLGLNDALSSTGVAANDAAEALKKAQTDQINALNEQAQRQIENAALIRSGTSENVKSTLAGIGDQIRAFSDELLDLQVGEKSDASTKRIAELKQQIAELSDKSRDLSMNILPVIDAREAEVEATKRQAEALQNAVRAADEYAANAEKLKDVQEQQSTVAAKRARDDARASQVTSLESQISAAKQIEAEQQRAAKVVKLRKDSAAAEIVAQNKLKDEIAKANADFMANSLKALRSYQLEESRATKDYSKERVRKLEDLYTSLSDIAASGDVTQFIQVQRAGLTDLQRGDEDSGDAAARRREDFDIQQAEAKTALDERLRDLRNSFAQEQAQRTASLQTQLQQEQAANQQHVLQSAQLQEQLATLREQWAAEDLARTRQEEDRQLAAQIAAVKKRNDELRPLITKAIDPITAGIKNFATEAGNAVVNLIGRVRSAASAAPARPVTATHGGGSGFGVAHALGAVYTKPTTQMSKFAEVPGYGDFVMPFRLSDGVLPALQEMLSRAGGDHNAGGLTINHLEIKAGSIATPDDLAALRADVLGGIQDAAQALGASGSMVLGGGMA